VKERITYTDVDFKTNAYRLDLYNLMDVYYDCEFMNAFDRGQGPEYQAWHPTKEKVRNFVKLMFSYSRKETSYQLFSNFFVYAMHSEVTFIMACALIKCGFFHLNGTKRADFCTLYDNYVARYQECPILQLDTKNKVGLHYSFIILCVWGPDVTVPGSQVEAEINNFRSMVLLSNDMSERFTKGNDFVVDYPDVSFDEVMNPMTGNILGEELFVERVKENIRKKYKELGPEFVEALNFTGRSGGCKIGALSGRPESIELYKSILEGYARLASAEIGRRVANWGDITSDEFYITRWLTIGTSGTFTMGEHLKQFVKRDITMRAIPDDRYVDVLNARQLE